MSDTPTPSQAAEKAIREALEAGPTRGPWLVDAYTDTGGFHVYTDYPHATICGRGQWEHRKDESHANAKLISACNPEAMTALLSQLAELRAEVERLLKNDARYRWLRQPGSTIYVDWIDFDGTPEQLDIAIDAALVADGKDGAR